MVAGYRPTTRCWRLQSLANSQKLGVNSVVDGIITISDVQYNANSDIDLSNYYRATSTLPFFKRQRYDLNLNLITYDRNVTVCIAAVHDFIQYMRCIISYLLAGWLFVVQISHRNFLPGFFETSAADGTNVRQCFAKLAQDITEIYNPQLVYTFTNSTIYAH
jgi:hypothetical protein